MVLMENIYTLLWSENGLCSLRCIASISHSLIVISGYFSYPIGVKKNSREHFGMYLVNSDTEVTFVLSKLLCLVVQKMKKTSRCNDYARSTRFENIIDASYNYGNKTVANNGQTRILSFFQWLFESDDRGTVICVGHSLWFRQVFQAFLPDSSKHLSKTKKIVNCGVIGLTLTEYSVDGGPVQYMIDPESVKVIYGGFQK
eukprot:m.202417 g.202417  ORF g.202417 m.202417 type:complete len:200 (+) comp18828_c0_seq7:217-816(+)